LLGTLHYIFAISRVVGAEIELQDSGKGWRPPFG
jgi:hypothetical protein